MILPENRCHRVPVWVRGGGGPNGYLGNAQMNCYIFMLLFWESQDPLAKRKITFLMVFSLNALVTKDFIVTQNGVTFLKNHSIYTYYTWKCGLKLFSLNSSYLGTVEESLEGKHDGWYWRVLDLDQAGFALLASCPCCWSVAPRYCRCLVWRTLSPPRREPVGPGSGGEPGWAPRTSTGQTGSNLLLTIT